MDNTTQARCENCRYWQREESAWGYCKRYAPRWNSGAGTGQVDALFPTVPERNWCGEFAPKGQNDE